MGELSGFKLFLLLWAISIGIAFFQFSKPGNPLVLPGDIYTKKTGRTIYIPTGTSLYIAIILYIIIKLIFKI